MAVLGVKGSIKDLPSISLVILQCNATVLYPDKTILVSIVYIAILRKVVGKSARDNPVWVILSALFFKEI